jgi:hypothetical protein
MFWPSGDHLGTKSIGPPSAVNWTGLDPSLAHIQISQAPDRLDMKAILFPSGEEAGSLSSRVDAINRVGLPGF